MGFDRTASPKAFAQTAMVGRPRLTDRARLTGNWCEQVIPGLNDSDQELTRLAEYLAGVSPDIPWHVAAFHKDYRMPDPENTSSETLIRAAEIGKKAGLHYRYAGTLPGTPTGVSLMYTASKIMYIGVIVVTEGASL